MHSNNILTMTDSYDIFHACEKIWGEKLKSQVLEREGCLVVRPDSGDPPTVVVRVLEILGSKFGYTVNSKGYKVLNPKIRVIQGDGIDIFMLEKILSNMMANGWSADNVAFGSGGGLLQKVNRDTCKFAFKCSAAQVNEQWRDVMKDPVTDPGKRSKAGRLALIRLDGQYLTVTEEQARQLNSPNLLVPVFKNGELLSEQRFADIRKRARN